MGRLGRVAGREVESLETHFLRCVRFLIAGSLAPLVCHFTPSYCVFFLSQGHRPADRDTKTSHRLYGGVWVIAIP